MLSTFTYTNTPSLTHTYIYLQSLPYPIIPLFYLLYHHQPTISLLLTPLSPPRPFSANIYIYILWHNSKLFHRKRGCKVEERVSRGECNTLHLSIPFKIFFFFLPHVDFCESEHKKGSALTALLKRYRER